VPDAAAKSSLDGLSAEEVVVAWLNAMRRGGYEQALALWDAESKAKILERSKRENKSPADWVAIWNRIYPPTSRISLLHQVGYGPYSLYEYQVTVNGSLSAQETVALRQEGKRWYLTLALADNAVVQGWKTPGQRIRRLPPGSYQRIQSGK
jgi:hypothetical protein